MIFSCDSLIQTSLARWPSGHTSACMGSGTVAGRAKGILTATMKRHNKSYTSEYRVWTAMKNRCLNPRTPNYPKYGGAGIRVCERWLESFQNFFDDIGSRPSLSHTLDRFPNQKGNYEPSNCRWATQVEQQNNRSDNIALTFDGKTQNISQWAREIGMDKTTLAKRIRNGWTHAKALTFPIGVRRLRKGTTK